MRLRFFLAYALLVVAAMPLFDHHTAERDPFHSHLAQTALAGHRHGSDPAHDHSLSGFEGPGVVVVRDGPAGTASPLSIAGISLNLAHEHRVTRAGFSVMGLVDGSVQRTTRFLLLPDPPPRLPA